MSKTPKRLLGVLLLLAVILAPGGYIALRHIDRWLFVALDPGPFDPADTPAPPDYRTPAAWAALPSIEDDADVALPALPAVDPAAAEADVFYVHPTTWMGKRWNGPIDDPVVIQATARGGTLIQASAFNACCAVFAPRYRQANGKAFVEPSPDGDRAIAIAYADVLAAFDLFLRRHSEGRPFILAGHSQGTALATRLLKERIWGQEPATRLVAAYLIGGPVPAELLGQDIPVCGSAEQTGCVVAYNARGPRSRADRLDFATPGDPDSGDRLAGRLCVNPLSWRHDAVPAPASAHAGALFFDTEAPAVLPHFAAAACSNGRLLITKLGELPQRDVMSGLLMWLIGPENYHPIEYQLFYVSLRRNAQQRVAAFVRSRASAAAASAPAAPSSAPAVP